MDPADLSRARLLLEAREAAREEALRRLALLRHGAERLAALGRFLCRASAEFTPAGGEETALLLLPGEGYQSLLLEAARRFAILRGAFGERLAEAERDLARTEARRAAAEHLKTALEREARETTRKREWQNLAETFVHRAQGRD